MSLASLYVITTLTNGTPFAMSPTPRRFKTEVLLALAVLTLSAIASYQAHEIHVLRDHRHACKCHAAPVKPLPPRVDPGDIGELFPARTA